MVDVVTAAWVGVIAGVWLLWMAQEQVCGFGSVRYRKWVTMVAGLMATDMWLLWTGVSDVHYKQSIGPFGWPWVVLPHWHENSSACFGFKCVQDLHMK